MTYLQELDLYKAQLVDWAKEGLSTPQISKRLASMGVFTAASNVSHWFTSRCGGKKQFCNDKCQIKEAKVSGGLDQFEELFIELCGQGVSYEKIADCLADKGVVFDARQISRYCKEHDIIKVPASTGHRSQKSVKQINPYQDVRGSQAKRTSTLIEGARRFSFFRGAKLC